MRADTFNLTKIFGQDARYVVPLFQRPYVWNKEKNWEPLWEDVQRAAHEVEDRVAGHPHFLGAIVLASVEPEFGQLSTWEVIDGQQRLTTLQVLLAAARGAAETVGDDRSSRLLGKFIDNDRDLVPSGHEHARWKVWPTNADQVQFTDAMTGTAGSGPLVEARQWFEGEITSWLKEADDLDARVGALVEALRDKLRLVVIDLEKDDDAQVIFETLNGRGTPLEAADLVKNLLFRVAKQRGDDVERLYADRWIHFDRENWREQVSVGRQFRSRLDVFLTNWLSMRTRREVTTSTLYAGMTDWLKEANPSPQEVFDELRRYATIYQSFDRYTSDTYEGRFFNRLNAHQTTTVIPALLYVWGLEDDLLPEQRIRILRAFDSFLMRRAVCAGSTKDYNNLFRDVLSIAAESAPAEVDTVIIETLAGFGAETRLWPGDEAFLRALTHDRLYKTMVRARLRTLLEGLEHELRSGGLTEQLAGNSGLTIEHVLPQGWTTNWLPLPEGTTADERNEALHRLGNLTLVTKKLNPTMSNAGWSEKEAWLRTHSLLRLTTSSILQPPPGVKRDDWSDTWDEDRIADRGAYLADLALRIWPGPAELLGRPIPMAVPDTQTAPIATPAPSPRPVFTSIPHSEGPGKGVPTPEALATADIDMTCRVCGETKPGRKFPTFSGRGQVGFPRDDECRDCQRERRSSP